MEYIDLYYYLSTVWKYLQEVIDILIKLINSNFGVAAAGAFFGSVGGYTMVVFTRNRAELLENVVGLNVAIALVIDIFQIFVGQKSQYLREMNALYESGKSEFIYSKTSGKKQKPLNILLDYREINFPYVNKSLVNSKLFEKIELPSRALILSLTLLKTINTVEVLFSQRNFFINQIIKMKNELKLNNHDVACLYYGIKLEKHGIIFESYMDTMNSIKIHSDSGIWFSKELIDELADVAKRKAKRVWFYRPKVVRFDFSDIDPELMPDDEDYSDWREKFGKIK